MYIFTYNNICAIISYPRELNKHTVIPANTETYQWATVDSADNPAPSKKKKKKKVIAYAELSETFNTIHCLELKWV